MGILACFLFPVLLVHATHRGREAALRAWQSSFADPSRPYAVRGRLSAESRKTRWGWVRSTPDGGGGR